MQRFSVIIPCYNAELFIGNCIEHLRKLSYNPNLYEIIFVDDCSMDHTSKVIAEFSLNSELNIRLIKNETNLGPGKSRRKAAEEAKGEYLCFLDSDDWYESNILYDLDQEIKTRKSDIVMFDMSYVLRGKCMRKNFTSQLTYGDRYSYLLNCGESLCNLAVKRSLFLSVPFVDIRNGEDLALVPLLIDKAQLITHIDKSYYNYLMREDSASLGKPSKMAYTNMLLAFQHIQKYLYYDDNLSSHVEFLGIRTVLYNSTLMAIKGGNDNAVLTNIVLKFSNKFPFWHKNIYVKNLNKAKRLYLWGIKHNLWIICKAYAIIHTYLLTKKF